MLSNSLPVEILRQIFRQLVTTIQHTSDEDEADYVLRHRAIELLRLVCHPWNDIVLADPWFWSEIAIVSDVDVDHDSPRPPPGLISLWLDRSGSGGLDISFDLPEAPSLIQDTPDSENEMVSEEELEAREYVLYFLEILPLLSHHSARWKTFSICSPINVIISSFLPSLEQAPKLREVNVRIIHEPDELYEGFSSLVSALDKASSLQRLSFDLQGYTPTSDPGLIESLYLQLIPTTLSRLTHFQAWDRLMLPTMLSILQYCRNLITLQVSIASSNNAGPNSFQRFELPCLEISRVRIARDAHYFFDYMNCPNLVVLSMSILSPHGAGGRGDHDFFTSLSTYLKNAPRIPKIVELSGLRLSFTEVLPLFDNPRLCEVGILEVRCATPPEDEVVRIAQRKQPRLLQDQSRFGWIDWGVHRELEHKIRELKHLLIHSDIFQPYT